MSSYTPPDGALEDVLVFVDLDDTLFRSHRKATGELGKPVTVTRQGEPFSYMAPWQEQLFAALGRMGRLIPTTARTTDAFRRVHLPFRDWAICAAGAVILTPDGSVEPAWDRRVSQLLNALPVQPDALAEQLRTAEREIDVKSREASGRTVFLSLRHTGRDSRRLAEFAAKLAPQLPPGWALYPHEHDLLLRPSVLGKAPAVRWLAERLRHRLIIGVGDRVVDAEFMACCQVAITPTDSQLFGALRA